MTNNSTASQTAASKMILKVNQHLAETVAGKTGHYDFYLFISCIKLNWFYPGDPDEKVILCTVHFQTVLIWYNT